VKLTFFVHDYVHQHGVLIRCNHQQICGHTLFPQPTAADERGGEGAWGNKTLADRIANILAGFWQITEWLVTQACDEGNSPLGVNVVLEIHTSSHAGQCALVFLFAFCLTANRKAICSKCMT
jgi:hypothetical protein